MWKAAGVAALVAACVSWLGTTWQSDSSSQDDTMLAVDLIESRMIDAEIRLDTMEQNQNHVTILERTRRLLQTVTR